MRRLREVESLPGKQFSSVGYRSAANEILPLPLSGEQTPFRLAVSLQDSAEETASEARGAALFVLPKTAGCREDAVREAGEG